MSAVTSPQSPSKIAIMVKRFFALVTLLIVGLAVALVGILWIFWTYGRDLPDYRQLAQYEPDVVTRIYAGNGALLEEYATQKRLFVPTKAIPPKLIQAFLSAEDKGFYDHFGVDVKALARAIATNIINYGSGRRPIGASTITQQIAKNFLLTNEVSYERKIKEAILAIRMERAFDKEQILALYLNDIYLGWSSYGVAAASLNYFDKALDQLELHEMAYLAALPKAPSNYHPYRKTKAAINRRNWVLRQMAENGFISSDAAQAAMNEPLAVKPLTGFDEASAPYFTETVRRQLVDEFGSDRLYGGGLFVRTTLSPDLQEKAERALREGLEALDKRQGWRGPLHKLSATDDIEALLDQYTAQMPRKRYAAIVTEVEDKRAFIYVKGGSASIPFELADWAYPPRDENGIRPPKIASLKEALSAGDIIMVQPPEEAKDRLRGYQPKDNEYALGQIPAVNGAIVALDPHTGRVLAMSGGYDYRNSEFNRATQAKRQPGSAFKPFVYLAALDDGYLPTTRILDAPLVVDQGQGKKKWKPANYTKKFYGPSIMRVGIEQSRNLMTARLAMALGMEHVQDYAKRFGIDDNMPPLLSMSLGAGETDLLSLTAAYGVIVNGGHAIEPSLIDRIQDRFGQTIYRHDKRDCAGCKTDGVLQIDKIPQLQDDRAIITDPASAYQMVSMLEGVVSRGTGRRIKDDALVIAGKTGTTNDNTNAWFIGFSPDLVAGVYVGYDTPRPLGKSETGSTAAVPIFGQFIKDALQDAPVIPFRRPDGVNIIPVNSETGLRAALSDPKTVLETFKPGQFPQSSGAGGLVLDGGLVAGAKDAKAVAPSAPALY